MGGGICLFVEEGTQMSFSNLKFNRFDLTLMFGSGNEPTTLEQFWSMFPGEYYLHNSGRFISNDAVAIETSGFNLWDEKWESGIFDVWGNGVESVNPSYHRCVNYIPCLPSTQYYFKGVSGQGYRILMYDKYKKYLGSSRGFIEKVNSAITTADNAYFIRFYYPIEGGDNNRCVNISNPSKNGTYEPYIENSRTNLNLGSIEVYSHNIWDEEWESGYWDGVNGQPHANSNYIRSKNPIIIKPNTKYFAKCSSTIVFLFYDKDNNYITHTYKNDNTTVSPSNAYYLRIYPYVDYGNVYNNDICINESSEFNGQYEPHGILTFTGGLKSAGNVYDEIVGNRYIKRVTSMLLSDIDDWNQDGDSHYWFTVTLPTFLNDGTAMCNKLTYKGGSNKDNTSTSWFISGGGWFEVYTSSVATRAELREWLTGHEIYYKLATPIEYELVEPINGYVKSGSTEERVSPNANGLSAPMVCDMTYDVDCEYILGEVNNKLGDIESILETI